jgi:hypothetical protein
MFAVTWSLRTTNCTCYATEDTLRIVSSFYYNPSHTSLQSLTLISYAVTRLHNYNPYTFVATITYFTLTHLHWLTSQLSLLSQIITHFPCLSPIETSLVGLLLTNWLVDLLPENWLPRHFSSPYKPSIVRAARAVLRHRAYRRYLGTSVLPCDVIAAARRRRIPTLLRDVIVAARRRPRLSSPPRSVYSFARRLADGCLAALCCATHAAQPNSWFTCHNIIR